MWAISKKEICLDDIQMFALQQIFEEEKDFLFLNWANRPI